MTSTHQSPAISLASTDALELMLTSAGATTIGELTILPQWVSKEPLRLHVDARVGDYIRLVVHIGKGAQVLISEMIESQTVSNGNWKYDVTINLEANARCQFVSLQQLSSNMQPHMHQYSSLGERASMHWHNTTLGGSNVLHELRSEIRGAHASSSVDWIFYAKKTEKQRLSATNAFLAPAGSGEITMKGVAEQKGHTICNGMIEIGSGGGQTDTYLTEDVLMLDRTSLVDAIPALEIKTNDVKASHSATVSRVTEEDLFYFAARGIDPRGARKMYVEGFLAHLTERIEDQQARQLVVQAIEQKYLQA